MTGRSRGRGNGFARPHAHDVSLAQKGTATTVFTIGREMLMVSDA
jgi:hypothetical protein